MREINNFYNTIPPVTKVVFTGLVAISLLVSTKVLPLYYVYYAPYLVFRKYQLWRLASSFLVIITNNSFFAVFEFYTLYHQLSDLELNKFRRGKSVLVWYLITCLTSIIVLATIVDDLFILTYALRGLVTYTYSQAHRFETVSMYGYIKLPAKYLPLFDIFFSFIFQQNFTTLAIGCSVGYIYQCIESRSFGPIYGWAMSKPTNYAEARVPLLAPDWLCSILGERTVTVDKRVHTLNGPVTETRARTTGSNHQQGFTGRGRRLDE